MSKVQRVAVCGRLVVLAAGRASRMRRSAEEARRQGGGGEEAWWEEAAQRPKPMIRVGPGGEPVLQVLLERAERAGFTSVTVVVAAGDALTPGFCAEWNETAAGPRMRVRMAVQPEPRGTGHAVQCALEQDPVPPGEAFVVCNGDNLPGWPVLARLRGEVAGSGCVAFDRDGLGVGAERAAAFAVAVVREGRLVDVVEKAGVEEMEGLRDAGGAVRISMNLFRLVGEDVGPHLAALRPHAERGEWELPAAVVAMVRAGGAAGVVEAVLAREVVLDVTRVEDVGPVREALRREAEEEGGRPLLEVVASTPEDAEVAARCGADRLELCTDLACGGLTSPASDVRRAVRSGLPVHALIRPRTGHFTYTPSEWEWVVDQTREALAAGASRAVVGGLDAAGALDEGPLRELVQEVGGHRLVVHRAIDAAADPRAALAVTARLGIRRVLTSGGAPTAFAGQAALAAWAADPALPLDITAGAGLLPEHVPALALLGLSALHASCRTPSAPPAPLPHFDGTTHPVDGRRVAALRAALDAGAAARRGLS